MKSVIHINVTMIAIGENAPPVADEIAEFSSVEGDNWVMNGTTLEARLTIGPWRYIMPSDAPITVALLSSNTPSIMVRVTQKAKYKAIWAIPK